MTFLPVQLTQLQQKIDQPIDRPPGLKPDFERLTSLRAIDPKVGQTLLMVRQTSSFQSAEQLASYLGLVPVQKQSGSSVLGRARLSKAGCPVLRAKLLYGCRRGHASSPPRQSPIRTLTRKRSIHPVRPGGLQA